MNNVVTRFTGHPAFTLPVSSALLTLCASLVLVHAVTIRQVKEIGMPASLELPQMEKRLTVLKDQVEAAQLQEVMGDGSAAEQLHTYVLPVQLDLERLLATFDILRDDLQRRKLLSSLSAIQVGTAAPIDGQPGLFSTPVTFDAEVTQEGMDLLLLMLRLSGRLTVSDTLSPQELTQLVNLTEQENPAALTVLEQFLGTDLLRYVSDPTVYENQVLRSLPSETFGAHFAALLKSSGIAKAKYLFGGPLGQTLSAHNLWPLPFLKIERTTMVPLPNGHYRLSLNLEAVTRSTR